jgi:hypothetical protein
MILKGDAQNNKNDYEDDDDMKELLGESKEPGEQNPEYDGDEKLDPRNAAANDEIEMGHRGQNI